MYGFWPSIRRLVVPVSVNILFIQDNEISREQRRRQRTDKELRDVRSKLDIKTAEHEEVTAQYSTNRTTAQLCRLGRAV